MKTNQIKIRALTVPPVPESQKDFSKLPAGMQQMIKEMLESKVNWKAELRNFIQIATQVLRVKSMKRPSRG
jgi:predicted metal-dependent peptidase